MSARYAARLAVVTAAYYVTAKAGLALAFEHSSITAVWPPTGISLAALVIWGYRLWPGVALGALLANSWTGVPLVSVLGITVGNTLEALAGAYLLARVASFRPSLERVRDVVALAGLAACGSTIISATVGVTSLRIGDALPADEIVSAWRTWWLGDMGGDLLVAPFLFVLTTRPRWSGRPARTVEAGAMLASLVAIGLVTFSHAPVAYFVTAPIIWAALRFTQLGAASASLIVGGLAVWFTSRGMGPFAHGSPNGSLLLSQGYSGIAAAGSLLLAAVVTELTRAREALQRTLGNLEWKVEERTAELAESRYRLAEAQLLARIGSWQWDIVENRVSWSDELYRIHGLEPDQFAASFEGFIELVHPDDRELANETVREALAERGSFEFDHRCIRPDGEERVLHAQGQVDVDGHGNPTRLFGTCQDVTERKRSERLKEEFLATVSHELRTPLASIIGYTDLLLDGAGGELTDQQRDFLKITERNARRQLRLVGDLLFASKLEEGELAIEFGAVELEELLSEALEAAAPGAERKGIRIELAAEQVPAYRGDRDRLAQLADNLISNALKFAPHGGSVQIALTQASDRIELRVTNTGSHIPAADRERVFERFFRSGSAIQQAVPGVGLGLAICKAIVSGHGGKISLESEQDVGTTFRVELPLVERSRAARAEDQPDQIAA
jgi:PAS domain S-box-containing protein